MIVVDTSAIVAIALEEPEGRIFDELMVGRGAIIGTTTLFEARMVLSSFMPTFADTFLDGLTARSSVSVSSFTLEMYRAATDAFTRYGRGRGHPACLNFGDCLTYAVARVHGLPLLFKGNDFVHTDIEPAYRPAP
ncbi:type II toxin-antitoxin system VapC family toxin [Methylobacterium sp. Leaf466]|uniref:type II toxin-antitoxin system VapC family toxin n=1 Tax=Methylobacterium sp. Leaf466 TaxID=1736386 RepID=UPI0006F72509|nr:type II toxin-antitoxin system VapC family toxin [Methylobacterium sp. Leaf466]KQT78899.1 twitching motility protein PilT [Methylobacterium sp. Leaf466]